MAAIWTELSARQQDIALLLGLLLPAVLIGALVLRGFHPAPLVRAMLWRFRWPNALFVLLIAVSLGIGIGLLAQERGLRQGTAAAADKFDLIVSAPGSEVTMMLAAVYLQPSDVPLLSGDIFNAVAGNENVALAAPLAFGDSYEGASVVGTTPEFVSYLSDGRIDGAVFSGHEQAVVGTAVPLRIGDTFKPAHGVGNGADHDAHDHALTVAGRMEPTGTPWDRAILIPVEAVWETHGLANGHAPERGDQIGPPFDAAYFPGTPAIIVHAEALWANYALRSEFTRDAETMAFFPGAVLSRLYRVMGDVRQAMSVMSLVTQVLVAASVLVGLLILIRLFQRQLALLRALGAPARFIFAVVWSYAAALLLVGALLGVLVGQAATWALSAILTSRTDIAIQAPLGWPEAHFVAGFITLATVLALLPAVTVMRQSIVKGLRG